MNNNKMNEQHCTWHTCRRGSADWEQTLHGDSDLLFCWLNCDGGESGSGRVASLSLKLSSVTNRLSFAERKVSTSAKSRREGMKFIQTVSCVRALCGC